jgi:hypothetical protein
MTNVTQKPKKLTPLTIGLLLISLICAMLLIGFGVNYQTQKSKSEAASIAKSKESVATTVKPVENTNTVNIKKQEPNTAPVEIKMPQVEDKKVAVTDGSSCTSQGAGIVYDAAQGKCVTVTPPVNNLVSNIAPKDINKYNFQTVESDFSCGAIKGGVTYSRKAGTDGINTSGYSVAIAKSDLYKTNTEQDLLNNLDKFIKYNSQDISSVNRAFHFNCGGAYEEIYKELDIKIKGVDYSRVLLTKTGQESLSLNAKILGIKNGVYFEIQSAPAANPDDSLGADNVGLAYKQIQSYIYWFETEFNY